MGKDRFLIKKPTRHIGTLQASSQVRSRPLVSIWPSARPNSPHVSSPQTRQAGKRHSGSRNIHKRRRPLFDHVAGAPTEYLRRETWAPCRHSRPDIANAIADIGCWRQRLPEAPARCRHATSMFISLRLKGTSQPQTDGCQRQWLPFTSGPASKLEPGGEAAQKWRELIGLRLPQ